MLKVFEPGAKPTARKSVQGATRKVAPTKPKLALGKILSRLTLCSLLLSFSAVLVWYWPQFSNRPVTTVAITGELKYIEKQKNMQKVDSL